MHDHRELRVLAHLGPIVLLSVPLLVFARLSFRDYSRRATLLLSSPFYSLSCVPSADPADTAPSLFSFLFSEARSASQHERINSPRQLTYSITSPTSRALLCHRARYSKRRAATEIAAYIDENVQFDVRVYALCRPRIYAPLSGIPK